MGTLFALQGPANCGKSESLKKIADILIKKYPSALVNNLAQKTTDLKAIISGINGHVIGIESQGDPNSRLKESLDEFSIMKCDIIFCACRTSGMTVKWIDALSNKYTVNYVYQIKTSTNQKQNSYNMAQNLISKAGL